MTQLERYITIFSLINAAVFYCITIVVFLVTRKTRLNKALATQKAIWLGLIVFVAVPAYVHEVPQFPGKLRVFMWMALSVVTWWVLYEVYRVNWSYGWRSFLNLVWCETKRLPKRALRKPTHSC